MSTVIESLPGAWEVRQLQVTALDPRQGSQQLDLFEPQDSEKENSLSQVRDEINQHFSDVLIKPARLFSGEEVTAVIAPAWQPSGARESIK